MTAARLKQLQRMTLLHLGVVQMPKIVINRVADKRNSTVINKWKLPKPRIKVEDEYRTELLAAIRPLALKNLSAVAIYDELDRQGFFHEDEDYRPEKATIRKYVREVKIELGLPLERQSKYQEVYDLVKEGKNKHEIKEILRISLKYSDNLVRQIKQDIKNDN